MSLDNQRKGKKIHTRNIEDLQISSAMIFI